jgi:ABC-type uncharacterized transport system substrate-binding protein
VIDVRRQKSEVTKGTPYRLGFLRASRVLLPSVIALLLVLTAFAAAQQPNKIPTVGFLLKGLPFSITDSIRIDAFRRSLRELGYAEGKNIYIEYRFAEGNRERLSDFAGQLVRLKIDVLVTYGTVGTLALKEATATIPIVMAGSADPVARGLVTSLEAHEVSTLVNSPENDTAACLQPGSLSQTVKRQLPLL